MPSTSSYAMKSLAYGEEIPRAFDFSKRFFQTNVILQSNVSLNTTPLTLEAEAQISSNNNLKIDNLEIYARTNDIALAALKCLNKNLSNDTTNIGELTLSLPYDILNFKTNNFEISAENLSAIFDVVVSKKGDITITQKKETNVSSFAIKAVDEVLLKDLSLFAKTNATFNVVKNNYNFDVQIRTSEVAGKSLKINISSNFENNKNTIVASATGAINALLNSVNIQTKDIVSTDCSLCMQLANNVEISSLSAKIFDNTKTYLELSTPKKIIFNKQVKLFEKSASVKLLTNTSLDFNTVSAKQIESDIEFTCLNSDIFVKGNIDVKDCKYKKIFDDIFAKTSVSGAISFVTNKSLIVFNSINLSNSASAIFVGDTVLTFDSGKFESIHVNANVQIPPILKLNSFKAFNNISKGAGNITLFYVPKQKINLNAKINNLVSKDFENEISVAILDFSKDFAKNKQTTRIQTKSERGNSDLHIVSTAKNIFTIKANNIVFEDAIILKSAFTNAEKSPTEHPCCVKINRCDSRAFWIFQAPYTAHINAKSFQIDSVRLQNFTAVINASADNFSAKNIYANIDNSSVSGNLNIKFSQQNKQPYCIENSEFSVENFDTSKTSLGKILDAKISAKAVITANASDIFELLKYPTFKVSANANNGTINLLDAIHNIDTSLLQAQIKSSASNTKEKTQIEKVINAFKQIPFDKAQIEFHRDSKAFDVTIANAVLKGKDISLHCNNAKIFFDITAPFDKQKILFPITAHIHNRELSSVIETSKSTSAEFATTEKFHIFGTLENPKTNLLEVLTQQGNSAINDGIKINLFK